MAIINRKTTYFSATQHFVFANTLKKHNWQRYNSLIFCAVITILYNMEQIYYVYVIATQKHKTLCQC